MRGVDSFNSFIVCILQVFYHSIGVFRRAMDDNLGKIEKKISPLYAQIHCKTKKRGRECGEEKSSKDVKDKTQARGCLPLDGA